MFCINCGYQLPEDARFCQKCGKPQPGAINEEVQKPVSIITSLPKQRAWITWTLEATTKCTVEKGGIFSKTKVTWEPSCPYQVRVRLRTIDDPKTIIKENFHQGSMRARAFNLDKNNPVNWLSTQKGELYLYITEPNFQEVLRQKAIPFLQQLETSGWQLKELIEDLYHNRVSFSSTSISLFAIKEFENSKSTSKEYQSLEKGFDVNNDVLSKKIHQV
jgi:hypothetical protein